MSISQQELMDKLLPVILSKGARYKKFQQVHARPGVDGEQIVSITQDGRETAQTATADDYVVKNLTTAGELYVVSRAKFEQRYRRIKQVDGTWSLYDPEGEVRALKIDGGLSEVLSQPTDCTFYIMASWGSTQRVNPEDYFVSPLPDLSEIYRVAAKEFHETYQIESD